MRDKVILIVGALFGVYLLASSAIADSSCLSYQSETPYAGNYAPAWDVFDALHRLLISTTCPSSGNDITITVGRGDARQVVSKNAYAFENGTWHPITLTGTAFADGWLLGSGTASYSAIATTGPMFIAAYACTYANDSWKCGCRDQSCALSYWQLQAYKGNAPTQGTTGTTGTTGATGTSGTTGTTGATTGGTGSANRSGLPWKSGVSPGTTNGAAAITAVNGFGTWRGRPVDVGIVFIGQNGWSVSQGGSYTKMATVETITTSGAVKALIDAGIIPIMTVPLVISDDRGQFAKVATSTAIASTHQNIANKIATLVSNNRIYLRLGHEADGGYPWSYTGHDGVGFPDPANPADYKAAWRKIAQIYRNTVPNGKLVWNVLKNTRQAVADYYPGDDVVDVISIDVYDNGDGGFCDSATSVGWTKYCLGSYNAGSGVSKGVGGILSFAKAHGKKIAVDEWGATNDTLAASDGANNSFFIAAMYDFFAANSAYIEYESYYNRAGGGRHQVWPKTDYNPLPSDAYLSKYHP